MEQFNDSRLELKSFMFQVEQMRMAQTRLEQLKSGASSESENAVQQMTEMTRQLEIVVDDSIKDFNQRNEVRIAPEQVSADSDFKTALERSLIGWQTELEHVQNEQIDQAIVDTKEGRKSARYDALEKREADLKALISEAYTKLNKVQERAQSSAFNNTVNQIVNNAKR